MGGETLFSYSLVRSVDIGVGIVRARGRGIWERKRIVGSGGDSFVREVGSEFFFVV